MAKKRGESGLSLIVGVDKPTGMSSHDVVNRVRRIFGERRVGHTGTLDPLASGAMLVCVGPATRLDNYLVGHDKRYLARIAWGASTDTDDAEGAVTATGEVPERLFDEDFARVYIASLVGKRKQLPPVYSALKVGGKKACDEARRGNVITLTPRDIEVYDARFVTMGTPDDPWWDVELHVSSGTYIRSIARDAGNELGCPAHLGSLRRTSVGRLALEECVSLETLEDVKELATLDPVRLLGLRFLYARDGAEESVAHGGCLSAKQPLFERRWSGIDTAMCACTSGVMKSATPPRDGELVSVIVGSALQALYEFDGAKNRYQAKCVFNVGVSRGSDC